MLSERLSLRIALVIGLAAVVGAALVSITSYRLTRTAELAATQHTLVQLAQTVRRTAAIAAFLDNAEIAEDVLEGLAKNEIVGAVRLSTATNQHFDFEKPETLKADSAIQLQLESPFTPGEIVGRLSVYPRTDLVNKNARDTALERARLFGVYTLVIAFLVMVIIQWQFVPALQAIAHGLNTLNPASKDRLALPAGHTRDELGKLVHDINNLLGIVEEKLESERLLRQEIESLSRRFRLIYERTSAGIALIDDTARLLMANSAFTDIIGTSIDILPDRSSLHIDSIFENPDRAMALIDATITSGEPAQADLSLRHSGDARTRWAACLFNRILDESGENQVLVQVIISDITDRKQREMQIREEAELDPLTHLDNRRSAERKLRVLLEKARFDKTAVALCIVDLDDFKPINDRHGHQAGDLVLSTLAERMRSTLRDKDIAARLGGDEFLLAITDVKDRAAIEAVAQKLLLLLTQEIDIGDGRKVNVGASIGIAISGEENTGYARLLAQADQAMYQIKYSGKNAFVIYSDAS